MASFLEVVHRELLFFRKSQSYRKLQKPETGFASSNGICFKLQDLI
jgi:hypothetical protein